MYRSLGIIHVKCYVRMYLVLVFFRTRSDDFWILNAMCMFIYLFVVYFSFAPVISAITHLYCELFYIQVLTMVIITETLTSTSHHDIFTYLDYIFSWYLHTVGFYPYLLSYCLFHPCHRLFDQDGHQDTSSASI